MEASLQSTGTVFYRRCFRLRELVAGNRDATSRFEFLGRINLETEQEIAMCLIIIIINVQIDLVCGEHAVDTSRACGKATLYVHSVQCIGT